MNTGETLFYPSFTSVAEPAVPCTGITYGSTPWVDNFEFINHQLSSYDQGDYTLIVEVNTCDNSDFSLFKATNIHVSEPYTGQ